MKKLMKKTALAATAFALALMVAISLSGSLALPAAANSGIEIGTSTPTAIPTPESGSGVTDSTCIPQRDNPNNPGGRDFDCDGLIDIATFEQLDAIRYDTNLTGNMNVGFIDVEKPGSDDYSLAFGTYPNGPTRGCPNDKDGKAKCTGYELVADIAMPETETWTPIGGWATTLDGKGHFISGMRVTVPTTGGQGGMFSWIGDSGKIRNLGLRDAEVTLNERSGGILAGKNGGGEIKTSYAIGKITYNGVARGANAGWRGPRANVGGLVGRNDGKIIGSWADVNIELNTEGARAGGLVGSQKGTASKAAKIVFSSAYGDIKITTPGASRVGGFIGVNMNMDNGKITDISESYAYGKVSWDDDVSWNNSHPKTTAGVFGCNATPATLTNVYYNDKKIERDDVEWGCSQIAGRTSP